MHRARLSVALLLALPLVACAKEAAPVPAPEPALTARAEAAAITAAPPVTQAAPSEVVLAKTVEAVASAAPIATPSATPSVEATALAKLAAPPPVKAKDENKPAQEKAKAPPAQGAGSSIPAPANGVLAAGAADKLLKPNAPPRVTMLDAGAEPRAPLAYALTKGSAQKLSMGMDMTMGMKLGSKEIPPTTITHLVVLLDMATTDQSAAGEWKIDSKLTGLNIEPKGANDKLIADAMRPQVEGLKGLGIGYWVNARGQVHDTKLDVPAGLPPAAQQMIQGMNQSFEAMVIPLPSDPIGVGAKWEVLSRLSSSGADLLQQAVYTLKARSGAKATVDVTLVQLAASDTIKVPGAPAGISAKVKAFKSGGTGTQALDTTAVTPETGTMQIKTAMTIVVQEGANSDDTSIDTVTAVQMKRR